MARTVTSTGRMLEVIDQFRGDHRVEVVFAVNDSSPFVAGVRELLASRGARIVSWKQLGGLRFDGAVTASENTELTAINAPILVLPHGIGFHKVLPDSRGDGRRLSGSVRPEDLRDRRVLIAVTHPDQAEELSRSQPASRGRTVLVADPVVERLRAGAVHRERYRQALGPDRLPPVQPRTARSRLDTGPEERHRRRGGCRRSSRDLRTLLAAMNDAPGAKSSLDLPGHRPATAVAATPVSVSQGHRSRAGWPSQSPQYARRR